MMKIKISNLSSIPIYQQIASEIRNKILSNELMSNMQLPSIRALSKELEVGIITIKKAYEVLLQENLIYSKGAVGYFVNEINREEILVIKKGEYLKEIEKVFENEQAENNKEENEKIDGKNVFGVMMLGAGKGEKLRLRAISENGGNPEEEIKLLEELRQLIEINKFFE